jgi:glycosyltransferase involved in cell wall biosynthesis
MTNRRVLVLNHFAVPLGEPGGTRHTELFSGLPGWDYLIVAARTNPSTRKAQQNRPGFRFVPVTPYSANGIARIGNWVSYAIGATAYALLSFRRRPDVVYASSPHLLAGLAGAIIAAVLRRPLVLEVRDMWPKVLVDMGQLTESSPIFKVLSRIESSLYRRADRIVVLAAGVRRSLIEVGVAAQKIELIPNAADPESFETDLSRERARKRYGFGKPTFVYTGAHGPANGLDLLLDAAAGVGDGADVVLVGDGVSRPALIERARGMGLANVRFLDPIPKTEIPDLLRAADVGVHCLADVPLFHYGVSPNKVFDYMAAGKPVLTNTPGDVAALIEGAKAGVAVQPGNLADGIRQMLSAGAAQRAVWGANGKAFIACEQSRQAMAGRLCTLLNSVAK